MVNLPRNHSHIAVLLLVIVPVLPLAACKRELPPAPSPASSPAPADPPASPSDPAPSDASLRADNSASNRVPPTQPQSGPAGTSDLTDLDITNDVRRVLANDPTLTPAARRILVSTSQGIVQLSGTLPSEREKEDVRVAVARVPGVKGVDNRITVR